MGTSPDFHKNYEANTKFPSVKGTKYLSGCQIQTSFTRASLAGRELCF